MSDYRRLDAPGATLFFTVVTFDRAPIFTSSGAIEILRRSFRQEIVRRPFRIDAIVVLPDHLHALWTLPDGDASFSMRWSRIKSGFTRMFLDTGGLEGLRSRSRERRSERAVWQRRFWEHVVRDDDEYGAFMDYIHWNPVKHGLASCPHAWTHSSFHRWVQRGVYAQDWLCSCQRPPVKPPTFKSIDRFTYE